MRFCELSPLPSPYKVLKPSTHSSTPRLPSSSIGPNQQRRPHIPISPPALARSIFALRRHRPPAINQVEDIFSSFLPSQGGASAHTSH